MKYLQQVGIASQTSRLQIAEGVETIHLIIQHMAIKMPVNVHVTEMKLSTRSKDPVGLVKDFLLVEAEIDDAIAD